MPTAPTATVAEYIQPSPTASGPALAEIGVPSPTAPGAVVLPPENPDPYLPDAVVGVRPAAVLFEPCFAPALPNGGNFFTVPGRVVNSRTVFTSTGTAGPFEDGFLKQPQPIPGIWCSTYYDGAVWRADIWHDGTLMLYWQSATSDISKPWDAEEWNYADDPGTFPNEDWNYADFNTFVMVQTTSGCLLVPIYAPLQLPDPLLLIGELYDRPFYASGETDWNGESWEGGDVWLQATGIGSQWIFGSTGSGPKWQMDWLGDSPPLGIPAAPNDGASGLIRILAAPPASPSPAVEAYTPPTPDAPSPTI